jgi:hypothetical protein
MPAEDVRIVSGTDDMKRSIFAVLVKRSYRIRSSGESERIDAQPFALVDRYHDDADPEMGCVAFESECAPYKLATDVVVVGDAHAPGEPVQAMNVSVEIASIRRTLRVTGDRFCSHRSNGPPVFSDPLPFTRMPIRYTRAYGGRDATSIPELEFAYPRNSIGRGVVLANDRDLVEGLPLPNVEDPDDLLTPERVLLGDAEAWVEQPRPAGFGWYHKTWYPRAFFAGVLPAFAFPGTVTPEERRGLVAEDHIALAWAFKTPSFDLRFLSGASPGLAVPFLKGNERVSLRGLTADGALTFRLPDDRPAIALDLGAGPTTLEPVLHTLLICPDERRCDLIWRGSLDYPGPQWLPNLRRLEASVA